MTDSVPHNGFYTALPPCDDFAALAEPGAYHPLPNDWWVATSDLVGSTRAVDAGQYKTVNMIAAAVISAQINAHDGADFPFIFGGDGASFAIPPQWKDAAQTALSAVRVWAREDFDMELRVGLVQMATIRKAGLDVRVARYRASPAVTYAMFAGGGLAWAEGRMKQGAHDVPEAAPGTRPDLTGLSCRWAHMPSQNGTILSVLLLPRENASPDRVSEVMHRVVDLVAGLQRAGHPSGPEGPGVKWPPKGALLEAYAQRGTGSLATALGKALFESFLAWVLIKTGWTLAGFDARRYRRVVGANADFRKFEDGLKMTLDCDPETEQKLLVLLQEASKDGVIQFGLHRQSEAMMTCIVPSALTDDHVHFVDGAAGGYTAAAKAIKSGQ